MNDSRDHDETPPSKKPERSTKRKRASGAPGQKKRQKQQKNQKRPVKKSRPANPRRPVKSRHKNSLFGIPLPDVKILLAVGVGLMIFLTFLSMAFDPDEVMRKQVHTLVTGTLNVPVQINSIESVPDQNRFYAAGIAIGNPPGFEPAVGMMLSSLETEITAFEPGHIDIAALNMRDIAIYLTIKDGRVNLIDLRESMNRLASLDRAQGQDGAPATQPPAVRINQVTVNRGEIYLNLDDHQLEPLSLPALNFAGPGAQGYPVTPSQAIAGVVDGVIREVIRVADGAGALDSLSAADLSALRQRLGLRVNIRAPVEWPTGNTGNTGDKGNKENTGANEGLKPRGTAE